MSALIYGTSIFLFLIGLFCIVTRDNLLKIVIGIKLMGYGVCLFFVMLGYKANAHAPIIMLDAVKHAPAKTVEYVDPLIQALIPAIMFINLAAIGLMLATCIRLYEKYWIFDISKIKDLKG